MKQIALALMAAALLFSCSEAPTDAPASIENEKIKAVESNLTPYVYVSGEPTWTIEERMEEYGVPGVSIAMINNGEIEWTKTYGVVNKETKLPVTDSTLFQAASISKPVSAYAALNMVQQGKLDLDKDVNDFLTSWKLPQNEFTADKKVTLRHLLNHSAGTTVHGFWGYAPDMEIPTLIQVLNGQEPSNSDSLVIDKFPEESYRYSGGGYNVMQRMMIDVEGSEYPAILKELVLDPLGMSQSSYNQPLEGEWLARAATGYLPDGSMTAGGHHIYPEMAPAGLWTTSEDLAKFALDVQETAKGASNKVLSQDMGNQFLTPFVSNCGLGIFIDDHDDELYFQHGGWNEGFSSQLMAHKDKGYGVVVMINSNHPDFIDELIRSVALSYDWDNYASIYERSALENVQVDQIVGDYKSDVGGRFSIYQERQQLFKKDAADEVFEIIPIVDLDSTNVFVSLEIDQRVQFQIVEDEVTISVLSERDGSGTPGATKLKEGETLPIDLLKAGDFEGGLKAYQEILKEDPSSSMASEENVNMLGYQQIWAGNFPLAKEIMKINTLLYPEAFNTFDSYAEVCFELKEYEEAITNYEKSLALEPQNQNAERMIERVKEAMTE